ncbi:MAG: hypothetical protein QOH79_3351, partial [Acidimicrobiaceae bacterium]
MTRRWHLAVLGGAITSIAISSAFQSARADVPVRFGSYTIA